MRIMEVEIKGETNVFYDNQTVVLNISITEFALKNFHDSIAYHYVRWESEAKELQVFLKR